MLDRLTALFAPRPTTAEAWLARMARPDAGARDQAAFRAWLEAEPEHLDQYENAKADLAALEGLRGAFAADLARLGDARARSRTSSSRPARRGLVMAGGATLAGLAAAAVLAPMVWRPETGRLHQSAPGRIAELTLDDGSRVVLDADSAIRVALAEDVRRVTVERGSAYFEVVSSPQRPFQVTAADRHVIATGTRFAVTRTVDGGEVSLLEGRVRIGRRDAARRGALSDGLPLAPGERARFRAGAPDIRKVRADVETATSWRRRRLVFHDAPLSQVIADASRYSDAPLILADPELGRMRVTAVLPLDEPSALGERMADLLPIRTRRTADGRIQVRAE